MTDLYRAIRFSKEIMTCVFKIAECRYAPGCVAHVVSAHVAMMELQAAAPHAAGGQSLDSPAHDS